MLFVDDLDRCPPAKVVEMLEAVQLLAKTELFIVVMALDVRYTTLCLEQEYQGILKEDGFPSGLDYLEKIIQIPYQVPPIHANAMKKYLGGQFPTLRDDSVLGVMDTEDSKKNEAQGGEENDKNDTASMADDTLTQQINTSTIKIQTSEEKTPEGEDDSMGDHEPAGFDPPPIPSADSPDSKVTSNEHNNVNDKPRLYRTLHKKLMIDKKEIEMMETVCNIVDVNPRAAKRMTNVYKLIKIIWDNERKHVTEERKLALLLLLAMCVSKCKPLRLAMCQVFSDIEAKKGCIGKEETLRNIVEAIFIKRGVTIDKRGMHILDHVSWTSESWDHVKEDLRLVRSFSFVGEYLGVTQESELSEGTSSVIAGDEMIEDTYVTGWPF